MQDAGAGKLAWGFFAHGNSLPKATLNLEGEGSHPLFDAKDHDSRAGFQTDDLRWRLALLVSRGAVPISPPDGKPYGARAAYLKGPGDLVFEIEWASSAPL